MCKCNKNCGCQPSPCQCNYKKSCVKDISTNDVVYNSTVEIPCFGIQSGTPLTEALQTIGETVCDIRDEVMSASAVIINLGDGEGVYSSDTPAGAKQLKSLEGSSSVQVSSDANEITFSVDETWLDGKISAQTDQTIVFFNTASPNSGSPVFTPNQPQDTDVIYTSSVNNSLWVWNGTAYVTYIPPSATPFNLAGTSNDAGGNKTTAIFRTGNVGINVTTPLQALHVVGVIRQSTALSSVLKSSAAGDIVAAVAGTDYLTPTGSAAGLTSFPTLNQNTTGNAATVTTIPTLSGDVTNTGNNVQLTTTGVTAGSYSNPTVSVDAKGRITTISSGGGAASLGEVYTDSQNSGGSLTGLYEILIPAGTMLADGDKVEAVFGGQLNTPGNAKTVSFQFNTASVGFNGTINGSFVLKAEVIRTSSSTARATISCTMANATSCNVASYTAINFAATVPIKLNAQGIAAGDIVGKMGYVKYIPKSII